MILKACCIIHTMVVEERKHFYSGDGAVGLREFMDTDSSTVISQLSFQIGEASPFEQVLHSIQVSDDIKCIEKHNEILAALSHTFPI